MLARLVSRLGTVLAECFQWLARGKFHLDALSTRDVLSFPINLVDIMGNAIILANSLKSIDNTEIRT